MAIALFGSVTHVDERGVEDKLVIVNDFACDNQAEGFDEKFPAR